MGKERVLLEYPKDRDVIVDVDKLNSLPVGTWDEKTMTYTIENNGYGKDNLDIFKGKIEIDDYTDGTIGINAEASALNKLNTLELGTSDLGYELDSQSSLVKLEAGLDLGSNPGVKLLATSLKFEGNVAASIQGDSYKVGLESGILGVGFEAKIGEEKIKWYILRYWWRNFI